MANDISKNSSDELTPAVDFDQVANTKRPDNGVNEPERLGDVPTGDAPVVISALNKKREEAAEVRDG
jgi:hypothetical protein